MSYVDTILGRAEQELNLNNLVLAQNLIDPILAAEPANLRALHLASAAATDPARKADYQQRLAAALAAARLDPQAGLAKHTFFLGLGGWMSMLGSVGIPPAMAQDGTANSSVALGLGLLGLVAFFCAIILSTRRLSFKQTTGTMLGLGLSTFIGLMFTLHYTLLGTHEICAVLVARTELSIDYSTFEACNFINATPSLLALLIAGLALLFIVFLDWLLRWRALFK